MFSQGIADCIGIPPPKCDPIPPFRDGIKNNVVEEIKNRVKDLRDLRNEIIETGGETIRQATNDLVEKYANQTQNDCTKALRKRLYEAEREALNNLAACGRNVTDQSNAIPKEVKKELKERLENECKNLSPKKTIRCMLIIAEEVATNANAQLDALEEELRQCQTVVDQYLNETIPAYDLEYQKCLEEPEC